MKKIIKFILCVFFPLLVGSVSGILTASKIETWYKMLNKPFFNPPNYLFGPVWTLLYILMGISFYMILQSTKSSNSHNAVGVFLVQLTLNFIWSFLFFKFQLLGIAFIEILILLAGIISMIYIFYKINKTAAILQIPYLLWVSFASILSGCIWWLN